MKSSQIEIVGDVALVALSAGLQAIIDVESVAVVSGYRWNLTGSGKNFYAAAKVKTPYGFSKVLLHRVILPCDPDMVVDHINGFGLDNRRSNLRVATHQQNLCNRGETSKNAVGLKGVDTRRGRFRAQIKLEGKKIHLGMFDTAAAAHAAYIAAAATYHGEFARMRGEA